MLELKNICVSFGDRSIISDFSMTLHDGEIVALLGPSGIGKSTLLRVICGLQLPDSGIVMLNGVDITNHPPHKRGIAMVFQDNALFPHLTVGENIEYGLQRGRQQKSKRKLRVGEMLQLINMVDQANQDVDSLSGGESKRVALARSLAHRPSVILLDEPLAGLDTQLHDQLLSEIASILHRAGTSVIWVTHDETEATQIAQRSIRLLKPSVDNE